MRLLCLAASSRVYGHVLVAGKPPTVAEIARIVGENPRRVEALIQELERHGVAERIDYKSVNEAVMNANRTLISRRMIADFAEHQRNSEAGKRGGNPQLLPDHGPKPNGGMSKRPLKPPLKAEAEAEAEEDVGGFPLRPPEVRNPPKSPLERGDKVIPLYK
jgi:hypothetical protein